MPVFKIIDGLNSIKLNKNWVDSSKFNSKDRIVDEKGQTVNSEYQGRRYRLVSKKERKFSFLERLERGFFGTLAVAASLGLALIFKSVQRLFTDSKKKVHFGVLSKDTGISYVDGEIVYKDPKLLFGGVEIDGKKQLNFALIQTNGRKKWVPVIAESASAKEFKVYDGSALEALLKLAQDNTFNCRFFADKHSSLFKYLLQHTENNIITEEEFFKFILGKDENGTLRICTLNKRSAKEVLDLLKEKYLSIGFKAATSKGETLFTCWLCEGGLEIAKKILDLDSSVIKQIEGCKESIFVKVILRGNHKEIELILGAIEKYGISLTNEENWVLKALKNDCFFSAQEFNALEQGLKQKIYYVANAFSNEQLVLKLKGLGMGEKPKFYKLDNFAYDMDVVTAKKVIKGFLTDLKNNGLLLTEEEFSKRDKRNYMSKHRQIGRIQGRNFVENTAKKLGLKHIKVPKKLVVVKGGKSSLNLALSYILEIMPKDNQITIYAEKIKPVDRKLSLEEAIEFMIILEKTGYSDFFGDNFFFAEDGIYFIDTEYDNFFLGYPKWDAIEEKIRDKIEDSQDVEKFMKVFNKRKADFEREAENREKREAEFEKLFEDPCKVLAEGYRCRGFKISLNDI